MRCARQHGKFHRTRRCFSKRALTNLQYTSQPINHTRHTRQTKHCALVPTSNRVVLHEARRHAHSSMPRDRNNATSYHAFARDTKPHRLAQHKASHQGRVACTSTGCYSRGRTRTRHSSLPYTSTDICPMQPCYIGQTAPLTPFGCGNKSLMRPYHITGTPGCSTPKADNQHSLG